VNDWEKATFWSYEKLQEDGKIKSIHTNSNDFDGKITGHVVFGVKEWFDENPEEARRLGWIKHIHHYIEKWVTYNKQTQYLMKSTKTIDEYTIEDVYHVMDKTEDMMRRAEENGYYADSGWSTSDGVFMLGDD
jgi:hypothetical protein